MRARRASADPAARLPKSSFIESVRQGAVAAHTGRGPRAGLDAEDVEEEVTAGAAGGRVLCGRDLADEGGRRGLHPHAGGRGDQTLTLRGGDKLLPEERRSRRGGTAHTVGAARFGLPWVDCSSFPGAGPMKVSGRRRRRGVPPVFDLFARVAVMVGRFVTAGVSAVGGDARVRGGGGCRLATHVEAGHGGEHAAPAAQKQGRDCTEI